MDYFSNMSYLPNPDAVLKRLGRDQTVYQEMTGDAHLSSVIGNRKSGVKSLKWEIDRGKAKSRQAKAITKHFDTLKIHDIFSEILDAVLYGFQPIEVMWDVTEGGLVMPVDLVAKPADWFRFGVENELRFLSRQNMTIGEDMRAYSRKFLVPKHNARYNNPYGDALLSKCFWPWKFKSAGATFWAKFCEKYGTPFLIGKLPRSQGEAEYTAMKDLLVEMVSDAVAAIPDDASIEIMEAGGKSSSSDIFEKFQVHWDKQMSKAIIGHGSAADSTPGKLGGEDNAETVRQDLIDEDKRLVESTLNQLLRWITEINFGQGSEAPKFVLYEEEDVDQAQADRDVKLTGTGQIRFTAQYWQKTYGFEDGDFEVVETQPVPVVEPGRKPAEFAEGDEHPFADQRAVDAAVDAMTDPAKLRGQTQFAQQLIDVFQASETFEDAMEKAVSMFGELDTDALRVEMENAIFLSMRPSGA